MPAMDILWPILLVVINLAWLVSIVAGLPGTWLMIASAVLLQWWRDATYFSAGTLIAVTVLAAAGEAFELLTGAMSVKKAGGTGHGAAGP